MVIKYFYSNRVARTSTSSPRCSRGPVEFALEGNVAIRLDLGLPIEPVRKGIWEAGAYNPFLRQGRKTNGSRFSGQGCLVYPLQCRKDMVLQVRKGKNLDITEPGQDLPGEIRTLFSTDALSLGLRTRAGRITVP